MNKLNKIQRLIFQIFISVATILFLSTEIIHADDKPAYSINKLDINCKIEQNGELKLTRTVTYKFYDNAHGLIYQQGFPDDDD